MAYDLNTVPASTGLNAAILPYARSVQAGTTATAFATIINASPTAATRCYLQMRAKSPLPSTFQFRAVTPTNQIDPAFGTNQPVDIPAGGARNFVFGITSSAASSLEHPIGFDCEDREPAPNFTGLNSFILSLGSTPVPDLVSISATVGGDGIVNIPGNSGTGFFTAAAVNIGTASTIIATADTGSATLPVTLRLCETNAAGVCINPASPSASVTSTVANNGIVTYAIFATGTGNIPFDPAGRRVFLRLKSPDGVIRGATTVAIRTNPAGPDQQSFLKSN